MISGVFRNRRCADIKARTAAIAVKSGCERIEILAAIDVFRSKQIIDLIAGETIAVKQDREVGVIGFHAGQNRIEADARDAFQTAEVVCIDGFPFPDFPVQMAEQAKAHGSTEFVHLCIAADVRNFFGTMNAEVFQIVQFGTQRGITIADGTALNGMENLG